MQPRASVTVAVSPPSRASLQIEVSYGADLGQPRMYLVLRAGEDDALWLSDGRSLDIGPAHDFTRRNRAGRLIVPQGSGYWLYLPKDTEGSVFKGKMRADGDVCWQDGEDLLHGAEPAPKRPGIFRQFITAPMRGEIRLEQLTIDFICLEESPASPPYQETIPQPMNEVRSTGDQPQPPINSHEEIPRHWLGKILVWVWNKIF
ncbi:hypothetical protein EXS71_00370 [Candidatus Uhrbacteria bacterium]|nr:hypothetical protein [Candidatus Uhrbacteria bacterium]